RDDNSHKTICFRGIVRCSQLENQLLLRSEIDFLLMFAAAQIPKMQTMSVLAGQQEFRVQPVLDHVWRSPFARYHRIVAQMPPEVVCKVLWSSIHFPLAEHVEREVIEEKDTTRTFSVCSPKSADVYAFGTAMNRVKS